MALAGGMAKGWASIVSSYSTSAPVVPSVKPLRLLQDMHKYWGGDWTSARHFGTDFHVLGPFACFVKYVSTDPLEL